MKMSLEDKRVQNTASSPRRWWEMGPRFHRSCGLCGARPAMSGHSTLRSGCSLVQGLSQGSSCTLAQHSRVLIRPPGGQLTWGPTGPGCQRHSGVARDARPTGEKEDFETEGLPSVFSLFLPSFKTVESQIVDDTWSWRTTQESQAVTRPLPQTMAQLMQNDTNDQSRYQQQQQSSQEVFLGAEVQSHCDVWSAVICCHKCWSPSVSIIKFRLSTTANPDDQI